MKKVRKKNDRKKILIIAMGNSMHTFRWINSMQGLDCDIFCFSSFTIPFVQNRTNFDKKIKLYNFQPETRKFLFCGLKHPLLFLKLLKTFNMEVVKAGLSQYVREDEANLLAKLINNNDFDLIHTLHTQTSAYLLQDCLKLIHEKMPIWVHTVWGSDLYLHQWIPVSRKRLSTLLPLIDCYWGEGKRDYDLARELGFKGKFLNPIPAFGGVDVDEINKMEYVNPSQRHCIIVKGYQNVVGRADVAFHALEMCADILTGYEIFVLSYENNVVPAIGEIFSQRYGVKVQAISGVKYQEILKLHLKSRIAIAISTSDGLPASFVESMACGEFPIQSDTSMGSEWAEDKKTAFFVPPGNTNEIAAAIRTALTDDELVDNAANENRKVVSKYLNKEVMTKKVINTYTKLLNEA